MSMKKFFGMFVMSAALCVGCGPADGQDSVDSIQQKGSGWLPPNPNNPGINIAEVQGAPANNFGINVRGNQWWMTGFVPSRFGLRARGYYMVNGLETLGYGTVDYAQVWPDSTTHYLVRADGINAKESVVSITLVHPTTGVVTTYSGDATYGVQFHITPPSPAGGSSDYPILLWFGGQQPLTSKFNNLLGQYMWTTPATNWSWTPLCSLSSGASSEPAVLSQGSLFDPLNAARLDSSSVVTVTCESGGIARCMSWGYVPWASGYQNSAGPLADLKDYHQACIQMKRAAYFGDDKAFTYSPTEIYINDALIPQINGADVSNLEALWDTTGAVCANNKNRRHLSIPYPGYDINQANPGKKTCDASFSGLLASAPQVVGAP